MKRRDLLKCAGTLMLGAQAVHASALLNPNPAAQGQTKKDLVVAFNGPFCVWELPDSIKLMAVPVGPDNCKVPHQAWFGTSLNEKVINVDPNTNFTLSISDFSKPDKTDLKGTPFFKYEQGDGSGAAPLFNLFAPKPSAIIGVQRTVAKMICAPGVPDKFCQEYGVYASRGALVYHNVDVSDNQVRILLSDPTKPPYFTPCFDNDDSLPQATLGVNLTAFDRNPDPNHNHAAEVWKNMLIMFPWMHDEITGIQFCAEFDPSSCRFDPKKCSGEGLPDPDERHKHGEHSEHPPGPEVGPGSDCEAPNCYMGPPGPGKAKYKKS